MFPPSTELCTSFAADTVQPVSCNETLQNATEFPSHQSPDRISGSLANARTGGTTRASITCQRVQYSGRSTAICVRRTGQLHGCSHGTNASVSQAVMGSNITD